MRPFVAAGLLMALGAGLLLPAAHGMAQAPAETPPAAASAAQARPGARLPPGAPIPPAELEAFVDGVVRDAMSADHIAGVTVSVVQNGQVALKKGYGFARRAPARPVDPDRTLFRLGPVSHTFTWIVVMKEVEAGHIRLTTPINLYLPEKLQVKDQGFKRPIYVGDLMTQSAGFEDRVLGHLFEDDPDRVRPLALYLRQERPRRVREAGTLSGPSDYGVALSGEAASYVTNKPFETLVEADITGPLGLAHTTFREPYSPRDDLPGPMPAALAGDLSDGYRWQRGGFQRRPFEYASQIGPAEAGSSTAADMARYMLMILGGGQLDGTTIYTAQTAAGFRDPPQNIDPGVSGWADGFKSAPLVGDFVGQGQEGATLSFSANLLTIPELDLGVFVAANTEGGRRLTADLPGKIVSRFYAPPADLPRPGSADLAVHASAYVGDYLTTRRAYGGLEKFVDQLRGWVRVTATDDGRLLAAGPNVAARAYAPDAVPDRFRQVDGPGLLTFQVENGRARRLLGSAGEGAYDRTGLLNQVSTLSGLAVLTLIASLATLIGLLSRDRRESRQTSTQGRAGLLQTTIAVLWLLSIAAYALWSRNVNDLADLVYHWPGAALMAASACALVAAVLTLLCLLIAPAVWRGGRRVDSWTAGRKLAFTLSTAIFTAFSVVLFLWGGLQPWSG